MWAVIVAGHMFLANGQPQYYTNHRTCLNTASVVGGQCVSVPSPPPQSADPAFQYLGCVATGACK